MTQCHKVRQNYILFCIFLFGKIDLKIVDETWSKYWSCRDSSKDFYQILCFQSVASIHGAKTRIQSSRISLMATSNTRAVKTASAGHSLKNSSGSPSSFPEFRFIFWTSSTLTFQCILWSGRDPVKQLHNFKAQSPTFLTLRISFMEDSFFHKPGGVVGRFRDDLRASHLL